MPHKSSSIPRKMFYWVMSAEIPQICKTTTKFQGFSKILVGGIRKQGGLINHMKKTLLKLFNSHEECFIKFGRTNYYINFKISSINF